MNQIITKPKVGKKYPFPLLTDGRSNPKTRKSEKLGYLTKILHMLPSDESGVANLCAYASTAKSKHNGDICKEILSKGGNIAAIYKAPELPVSLKELCVDGDFPFYEMEDPIIHNGEEHDLTFLREGPAALMLPFKGSGRLNPKLGCSEYCLNKTGMGGLPSGQAARMRRTLLFVNHRLDFMRQLFDEVRKAKRQALRRREKLCIRLNGTTDVLWEYIRDEQGRTVFEEFSEADINWYDYTKDPKRMMRFLAGASAKWPPNYHLTFSLNKVAFNLT